MDVTEFKERQRRMWAAGDFPDIAKTIEGASLEMVEAVGVQAGDRLLDIATGSGNATIPAAKAGAQVIGLDLTPELFEVARARAAGTLRTQAEYLLTVGRLPG